ncbi:hypothetical protein CB1_001451025 [Camelus ferus]|nr:hypothetical protein CB1_001451025 [Camelus ferus]
MVWMEKTAMKALIVLVLGTNYWSCAGFPVYDYGPSSLREAVRASLAKVNSQSLSPYLFRAFRSSVKRVNVLDEDSLSMDIEFGIRETTCRRDSGEDPATCDFQRGYYVPVAVCRSTVRVSAEQVQDAWVRCHWSSSSESNSSEEGTGSVLLDTRPLLLSIPFLLNLVAELMLRKTPFFPEILWPLRLGLGPPSSQDVSLFLLHPLSSSCSSDCGDRTHPQGRDAHLSGDDSNLYAHTVPLAGTAGLIKQQCARHSVQLFHSTLKMEFVLLGLSYSSSCIQLSSRYPDRNGFILNLLPALIQSVTVFCQSFL